MDMLKVLSFFLKTPGNTRENSLSPFSTQDEVEMSQSFSLEHCQGMLPVKLCSQVRILSTSIRKCTHYMPDCHLDVWEKLDFGSRRMCSCFAVWVLLRPTLVGDRTLSPLEGSGRALGISVDWASSATEGTVCFVACVPRQFPLFSWWLLGLTASGQIWPEYKDALGRNDDRERETESAQQQRLL